MVLPVWMVPVDLIQHYRILARLEVEPRPTGYIPGALPLSYLALGIRWYCLYYHHCGRLDIWQLMLQRSSSQWQSQATVAHFPLLFACSQRQLWPCFPLSFCMLSAAWWLASLLYCSYLSDLAFSISVLVFLLAIACPSIYGRPRRIRGHVDGGGHCAGITCQHQRHGVSICDSKLHQQHLLQGTHTPPFTAAILPTLILSQCQWTTGSSLS